MRGPRRKSGARLPRHAQKTVKAAAAPVRMRVWVSVTGRVITLVPGLDLTFFDLPLGIARFVPSTGMVHWSDRYEENVMPEVERLMAEVGLDHIGLILGHGHGGYRRGSPGSFPPSPDSFPA